MSAAQEQRWVDYLEEEDLAFVKRFILFSGSLKDLAGAYNVSYPTLRLRLDRLIEKVKVLDNQKIEDPYEYRDRLTMPKYIVEAAGDQYFLPDSSQFYYPDLKGEKYLRYVPNADHSLKGSDAEQNIGAFYQTVIKGVARPRFTWTNEANGDLRIVSQDKPTAVKLWQATNPEKRDFRLAEIGPAYKATDLEDRGNGVYVGHIEKPAKGWTAYFVEMTYANPAGGSLPLKFTTNVRVSPEKEPYPAYVPKPHPAPHWTNGGR